MFSTVIGKLIKVVIAGLAGCVLFYAVFYVLFSIFLSVREYIHETDIGATLSPRQTQEKIFRITNGCSRGGLTPRGFARSFWLSWERWLEFDLTEEELNCLKEKGMIDVECTCDQRGYTPPDWFKPEGNTFTFPEFDRHGVPSRPCIWHKTGGKYWLAQGEGIWCGPPESFNSDESLNNQKPQHGRSATARFVD